MTRGAALFLALGFASAAFLYGGVWEYGDGFLYNRFSGQVIYVELPQAEDAVQLRLGAGIAAPEHRAEPAALLAQQASGPDEASPHERIALHRLAHRR